MASKKSQKNQEPLWQHKLNGIIIIVFSFIILLALGITVFAVQQITNIEQSAYYPPPKPTSYPKPTVACNSCVLATICRLSCNYCTGGGCKSGYLCCH